MRGNRTRSRGRRLDHLYKVCYEEGPLALVDKGLIGLNHFPLWLDRYNQYKKKLEQERRDRWVWDGREEVRIVLSELAKKEDDPDKGMEKLGLN